MMRPMPSKKTSAIHVIDKKKVCLVKRRKNHLYIVGGSVTLQRYPPSGKPRATVAMARCLWSSGKRGLSARWSRRKIKPLVHPTRHSLPNRRMGSSKKKGSGMWETSHTLILTSIKSRSRLMVSHVQYMPVIPKTLPLLYHYHGHWKGRRKQE